jgi:hypothetical protein
MLTWTYYDAEQILDQGGGKESQESKRVQDKAGQGCEAKNILKYMDPEDKVGGMDGRRAANVRIRTGVMIDQALSTPSDKPPLSRLLPTSI